MTAKQPFKVRMVARRNRLFGHPRFQYWCARIPGLKRIAKARAGAMFDLVVGFSYYQVLRAVVDAELLPVLRDGPLTAAEIAPRIDLSHAATLTLLRAARSVMLSEEVLPDQWMLGEQGAVLVDDAGTQAMVRHHRLLYADGADPLAMLKADRKEPTQLSQYWSYAGALHGTAQRGEDTHEYSQLMATSQDFVANEVLASFRFPQTGKHLDVGGGHGAFIRRVGAEYSELCFGLFDLPQVVESGAKAAGDALGSERVAAHPGNFFENAIPQGYDLVSLVRILHDHDDEPAQAILNNIFKSLKPGARLMIAEPMAQVPGAEAMGEAFFGFYLWAMGSGRPRSEAEITAMLKTAGFRKIHPVATAQPVIASIIVASA
ncbi:MAG: methyltransferase [Pseudomonadota bacterium]